MWWQLFKGLNKSTVSSDSSGDLHYTGSPFSQKVLFEEAKNGISKSWY